MNFFYKKNLQGDIIGIIDSNGEELVKYVYDAWGNHNAYNAKTNDPLDISSYESYINTSNIQQFIAIKNPFRYRGYYYDFETGLYYLNSRYYDPEIGRFVNADSIDTLEINRIAINGFNLYAYCLNNPVNEIDENGYFLLWLFITAIVIGAAVGGTVNGVKAYKEGARGWGLFGAIAGGAIMGGAMGAIMTLGGLAGLASIGTITLGISTSAAIGISVGIGIGAGLISYSLENGLRDDRQFTWQGFLTAGFTGGLKALSTFAISYYGGRFGAFDKIFLKQVLGKELVKDVYSYGLAKALLSAIIPSTGRTILTTVSFYIGEFLTKLLFVNGLATGARWLIDKIFNKE